MKVLVVTAHPSQESFLWALRNISLDQLRANGHDVRTRDLWQEEFDPVFSLFERKNHVSNPEVKFSEFPELRSYVQDLLWCDALVLVYPTWWSSQPAILKGWIDRIFMNEVAWKLEDGRALLSPNLKNIRHISVVTVHGGTRLLNWIEGEGGKRIAFRSLRSMFHWRTKTSWIAVYGLDKSTAAQRERAKTRVRKKVNRAFPSD